MAGMISNDRLKDFNNVRSQPGIGDPMNRPTVQFDKYDEVNKMWICQACYMDGTTTNGGDCKCEGCCATNCSPTYNYDERKKQTIPTYIWVIMGALGAGLLVLIVALTTVSVQQATGASVAPLSLVNNPGESFALDNQWQLFKSVGPTQPANWVKSGNQATYGQWPTYVWDPTLAPNGPLFPSRMNSVRLEITWGAFAPQSTGGLLGMKVRMIIPNHWYNTKKRPWVPYYYATCSIGTASISSKGKDFTQQFHDLTIAGFPFPNGTNQQYPFDFYKTDIDVSCNYVANPQGRSPVNIPGSNGPLNFFLATDPSNIGFFQSAITAARPQVTTSVAVVLVATPPAKATLNMKTPVSTPTAIASSPTPVPGSGGKTWLQLYCASVIKSMGFAAGNAACAAKATSGSFSRRRKLINVGDPATIISVTITAPKTSTFALASSFSTAISSGAVTQAFTAVAPTLGFTLGTSTAGIITRTGVPSTDDGNSPTNDDLSKAAATDDGASGGTRTDYKSPTPTLKPVLSAGVTGKPSYQPTGTYFVKTRAPVQEAVLTIPPTAAGYTPAPTTAGQTNTPTQGYVLPPQAPTDDTLNQLLGIGPAPTYAPSARPVIAPVASPTSEYPPSSVSSYTYSPAVASPTSEYPPSSFSYPVASPTSQYPPSYFNSYTYPPVLSSPTSVRQRGMTTTTNNESISDIEEVEEAAEEEEGVVANSPGWEKRGDRYIRSFEEGHEEMPDGFRLGQYNEKGVFVEHTEGGRERAPYESDEVDMAGHIINLNVRDQGFLSRVFATMAGSIPAPAPAPTKMAPTQSQRALDGFVSPTNPLPPGAPTHDPVPGYQNYILTDFIISPFRLNMSVQRAPINIVFPMFLLCIMWLMVIGQILAYLPFFLRVKPVDAWSMATSAGPLIFALTSVRNTMPGAPPIGVVMDFTTYYWCLAIIVFNHIFLGVNWALFSLLRPQREKALKNRQEEAKRLEQKALTACSVDEIVRLFESGKREALVPFIKEKKIDGKLLKLAGQSEKALTECGFEVTGLAKWKLLNEIDGWIKDGVDRKKIEKVITTIDLPGNGWYSVA